MIDEWKQSDIRLWVLWCLDTGFDHFNDLLWQCFLEGSPFIINTSSIFILFERLFITNYHQINITLFSKQIKFTFILITVDFQHGNFRFNRICSIKIMYERIYNKIKSGYWCIWDQFVVRRTIHATSDDSFGSHR